MRLHPAQPCTAAVTDRCARPAQDDRGIPYVLPHWLPFWEDIVDASGEPGPPDACMRGRRELFWQAVAGPDGTNLLLGGCPAGGQAL